MKDFSEVWPGLRFLSCERLSSNADNFRLVDDFFNRRNDGIADTLRNEAFSEDEDGTTAYYLVKHENGRILFFFSLKCGLLYDQFLDTRQLKLISDLNAYLDTISGASDLSDDDRRLVDLIREKLRTRKGITKADQDRLLQGRKAHPLLCRPAKLRGSRRSRHRKTHLRLLLQVHVSAGERP